LSQVKKQKPRVCVLVKRQEYEPVLPGRECASRMHGHMTYEKADELVDQGLAEWIKIEKISRSGKVTQAQVNGIRLIPRRNWRAKASRYAGRSVKVMQLVH